MAFDDKPGALSWQSPSFWKIVPFHKIGSRSRNSELQKRGPCICVVFRELTGSSHKSATPLVVIKSILAMPNVQGELVSMEAHDKVYNSK
jgi:hypothetical protein